MILKDYFWFDKFLQFLDKVVSVCGEKVNACYAKVIYFLYLKADMRKISKY